MRRIKLTQRKWAIIDDDMFDFFSGFTWHAVHPKKHLFYAATSLYRPRPKRSQTIMMHHLVSGRPINGKVTDHINGNSLDNRRQNLRTVTVRQNNQNRKIHREGKLPGVMLDYGCKNSYVASYRNNGKMIRQHGFKTKEAAYAAYCEAVAKIDN